MTITRKQLIKLLEQIADYSSTEVSNGKVWRVKESDIDEEYVV